MNNGRWSQSAIFAGVVGGLSLGFFLLIAGFAGPLLVETERAGWRGLMALLAASGALFVVCLWWGWHERRALLARTDPDSTAAISMERDWYGALGSVAGLLAYGAPLVLVRQTYWSWAPWAALLGFLVCLGVAMVMLRRAHRLTNAYYASLSPAALQRELERSQPGVSYKTLKRIWYVLFGGFCVSITFLVAGAVMQWIDGSITFPPRTVFGWMQFMSPLSLLFFSLSNISTLRQTERWRQRVRAADHV